MDAAEQPAMLELRKTYGSLHLGAAPSESHTRATGKTIHTWAFDEHPDLPLGPPQLMMSWTSDTDWETEGLSAAVAERDAELGVSTQAKRELRDGYIPKDGWEPDAKADYPSHSGKSIVFTPVEREVKTA